MSPKLKTGLLIGIAVVLAASVPVGVYLVSQQVNFRQKASTPTGDAKVSISPASSTANVGDAIPVKVAFNTAGIPISAVALRLTYAYSGPFPEAVASTLNISPTLLASGDWTCPVKTVTPQNGTVNIDVNCVNTNAAGYSTTSDVTLVSFTLTANSVPATNPLVLSFDASKSFITRKTNGEDILLTPSGTGSYTFNLTAASPTAVPTSTPSGTKSPTPKPTATPKTTATPKASASPTPTSSASASPVASSTAKPTASPSLPDSGLSTPAYVGIAAGVLLLFAAVALIL